MTSASRYADAAVWDLLQHARDRGAALGIVLSRVNEASAAELVDHFAAMLEANGLSRNQRFLILETVLTEGKLPPEASGPIRQWLTEAAQSDRRVAVLSQTMSGVLDTFPTRVPALAAQVEAQAALRDELITAVAAAYRVALTEFETSTADGSLMRGEVLARWQDFAGSGELLRALQARRAMGQAAPPPRPGAGPDAAGGGADGAGVAADLRRRPGGRGFGFPLAEPPRRDRAP